MSMVQLLYGGGSPALRALCRITVYSSIVAVRYSSSSVWVLPHARAASCELLSVAFIAFSVRHVVTRLQSQSCIKSSAAALELVQVNPTEAVG